MENQIQDQGEVAKASWLSKSNYNFSSEEDELEKGNGDAHDDEINARGAEIKAQDADGRPARHSEAEEEIDSHRWTRSH